MSEIPESQPQSESEAHQTDPSLQGQEADLQDEKHRADAIDQAFDYRGDVTIETSDGKRINGFLYDRNSEDHEPYIRIMPSDGSARLTIPYIKIQSLVFSGKDTAFGKSWEAWVRKHAELKAKGQKADIEAEPLD